MIEKLRLPLAVVLWLLSYTALLADGGAVRLSERRGHYQITVFTSPTPIRAGPVDISVFVQDAATGEPSAERDIVVYATPRSHPDETIQLAATTAAATNKLFQAAVFDLPEAGWWDVAIRIEGPRKPVEVSFEMEAGEPLPHVWAMAPWIVWPLAAILLFLVHKRLVWLKARQAATTRSSYYE